MKKTLRLKLQISVPLKKVYEIVCVVNNLHFSFLLCITVLRFHNGIIKNREKKTLFSKMRLIIQNEYQVTVHSQLYKC